MADMMKNEVFRKRRQILAEKIGPRGTCLLFNAKSNLRNGDTHYPYRGHSNFLYLCPFNVNNSVLVITGGKKSKSYLITAENNPHTTLWTGPKPSFSDLKKTLLVDDVFDIQTMKNKLFELSAESHSLWIDIAHDAEAFRWAQEISRHRYRSIRQGSHVLECLMDLRGPLSEMRLRKDKAEIDCMKEAVKITDLAHREAMKQCQPGMKEYEIEALINWVFKKSGGDGPAYTSIVGNGQNACVLHYTNNDDTLKKGDLLLIDAGVEYNFYAADVTRTFPVDGCFTEAQKEIYSLVLKAQEQAISIIKPGIPFSDIHQETSRILAEGLLELGVLKCKKNEVTKQEMFKKLYPHNTSHWLGLDVHDVGIYKNRKKSRKLEAGMVLTVEPGLYFSQHIEDVDPRYRGIGIRIEDDILVTPSGFSNLTESIPKSIRDIEKIMKK
jgi:Xaa-Pro aminopeptidase